MLKKCSQVNSVCFSRWKQLQSIYLEIEGGDVDILARLPQQVLIVGNNHILIAGQVTVHLQHLRTMLYRTDHSKKDNVCLTASVHNTLEKKQLKTLYDKRLH